MSGCYKQKIQVTVIQNKLSDGAYHNFSSISENLKNRLNLTLIYFQLIGVVAACCLLKKNDVDDDDGLKRAAKFWCVKNFAHWPWSTRTVYLGMMS